MLVVLALSAGDLGAQTPRLTVDALTFTARVRSELPAGTVEVKGPTFGGEGTLSLGRLVAGVSYFQGTLGAGSTAARDLVEGRALLGVRPFAWLTVGAGPRARAYVITGATQRWIFWELRTRAEAAFIGSAARGYAEFWRAVSANVNVPETFDHAQGGEAGMIVRFSRVPLEARVAYRIDHTVLGGGSRLETVDGVLVQFGLARR